MQRPRPLAAGRGPRSTGVDEPAAHRIAARACSCRAWSRARCSRRRRTNH